MAFGRWTSGMKSVFQFVLKGVRGALSKKVTVETITELTEGVSEGEVSQLWDVAEYQPQKAEKLRNLPKTYTPSEELGVIVDWDLEKEHVMQMKIKFWSESNQTWMEQWITVESDEPLTMLEWDVEAEQIVSDFYPELQATNMQVIDYSYLIRNG